MPEPYHHEIPGELIKHVTAICGERGVDWLARLPEVIAELEELWGVKVGEPFIKGEFNFVAPASSESGIDAVLKISPPYERIEIFAEAEFLRNLSGKGAARLFQEDRENRAILIERIRPGVTMDVYFKEDPFACVEPAIKVLKSILARPPYPPSEAQLFYDWYFRFQRSLDSEFPFTYANKALMIFDRLFQDDERTFHLHGDFHPGNVVSGNNDSFVALDPKGLVGHVTYDISVFLNNLHWWQKGKDGVQENLFRAARQFGEAFDIDDRTIREAAYAGMVIGAWWNFDEMPEHYNNEVALADVWDI